MQISFQFPLNRLQVQQFQMFCASTLSIPSKHFLSTQVASNCENIKTNFTSCCKKHKHNMNQPLKAWCMRGSFEQSVKDISSKRHFVALVMQRKYCNMGIISRLLQKEIGNGSKTNVKVILIVTCGDIKTSSEDMQVAG